MKPDTASSAVTPRASRAGTPRHQPGSRERKLRPWLIAGAAFLAIVFVQTWMISAGTFWNFSDATTNYYSLQADAFLAGQTNLPIEPAPELLALRDPYDPAANEPYRVFDFTLHKGHYYLYFGPVPAILLMPFRYFYTDPGDAIADSFPVYFFMVGALIASTLLMLRLRSRCFAEQPAWTIVPGMLTIGLSLPCAWLLFKGNYLEVAIAAGQFFLVWGVYLASFSRPKFDNIFPPLAAGVCWALAIGCRFSLWPCVAAMIGVSILFPLIPAQRRDRRWQDALAMILPAGVSIFMLLYYNYIRFGAWTQSGWGYQLTQTNNLLLARQGKLTSASYIWRQAIRFIFELPVLQRKFPFFLPNEGPHWPYDLFNPPAEMHFPALAGVVWTVPLLAFAFVPVAMLWSARSKRRNSQNETLATRQSTMPATKPTTPGPTAISANAKASATATSPAPIKPSTKATSPTTTASTGVFFSDRLLTWSTLLLLTATALGASPATATLYSAERYLVDSLPAATILAIIGLWLTLRHFATGIYGRRIVAAVVWCLTFVSVCEAILVSMSEYSRFSALCPELFKALSKIQL